MVEDNMVVDKMVQEIFKADNEEEYILFQRATPSLKKLSSLLQIYLTSNTQDKMAFLTGLFQVPPLNHRDDILFSYEPYTPSPAPSSRVDSRQSLPNASDQHSNVVDLPNAFDQTSDVTHGLSYPHVEGFQLTEEFIEDHIREISEH